MTNLDSLKWHVMDATADDWESIDQIRPHVCAYHGPESDVQIFEALRELHQHRLVCLMDENGNGVSEFPGDPSKHWFAMTAVGRRLWDDEGAKYRFE